MRRLRSNGIAVSMVAMLAACGTGETQEPPATTVASGPTTAGSVDTLVAPPTTVVPATTIEALVEPWIERDLVFFRRISDGATLTLDIHFPTEPENAPIVNGSTSLVEEGMIVFDISDDDHLGEGPGGPEEIVADSGGFLRNQSEMFGCAVRFVRSRAAELGNDDPQVVLSGVSFGGGLAVQVALFGDTLDARWEDFAAEGGPARQFECETTDESPQIDAVIGMAGTYDLSMPIFDGSYGRAYQMKHNPEMQKFLASAIGANPDLKVRLIHGTFDDIPVEYAEEFAGILTELGYDAQLITWPGGHEAAPDELFLSTLLGVLDD